MGQTQRVGGRATSVLQLHGDTVVVYHSTAVVKFNAKRIELNTGGWRTMTTRARMNQASNQYELGYWVFQKAFKWFVEFKGRTIPFTGRTLILKRS